MIYSAGQPDEVARDVTALHQTAQKFVALETLRRQERALLADSDRPKHAREQALEAFDQESAVRRRKAQEVIQPQYERLATQLAGLADPATQRAFAMLNHPQARDRIALFEVAPPAAFQQYTDHFAALGEQALLAELEVAAGRRTDLPPEYRQHLAGVLAASEPAVCGPARESLARLREMRLHVEIALRGGSTLEGGVVDAETRLALANRFSVPAGPNAIAIRPAQVATV